MPWPVFKGSNILHHGSMDEVNGSVGVAAVIRSPISILFQNFLSPEECQTLIAQAEPSFTRSTAVNRETGASEVYESRTSQGMFFKRGQTELIATIERRIAEVCNWPVIRGEGLQVLKYEPGNEYLPHNDYFDPNESSSAIHTRNGGQRIATLLMYLNTVEEGGATVFPDTGGMIPAVQGNAYLFHYAVPDRSTMSLHGGAPVIKGIKYVATKWFREADVA